MRVIDSGIPEPPGKTNAEKRAWMKSAGDHYRRLDLLISCDDEDNDDNDDNDSNDDTGDNQNEVSQRE